LSVYPVILDPITSINVAKNSFRIDDVKEIFKKGFEALKSNKVEYDQNSCIKTENIIYQVLLTKEYNTMFE